MKKKILFMLIGILVLAALVFLGISIFGKKTSVQDADQSPVSNPALLPSGEEDSEQNIQSVATKIENIAESPVSQQAVEEGIEPIDFKDAQGNKISLTDFEKATKISIIGQLRKYLDSKDYDMYYCPAGSDEKDYAVYFGYDVGKGYGDLYSGTVVWMKDWEKTMLPDLHAVLFPNANFSQEELSQQLQFKDGDYRYAEVRLPDGKTRSMNYYISGNGVIISASPSCLDKLVEIYDPLEP